MPSCTGCSSDRALKNNIRELTDALEAADRMSRELRNVGPLILVIDDAQWADRDSLNVLDRLQHAEGEIGLGIITVSRDLGDRQRVPAMVRWLAMIGSLTNSGRAVPWQRSAWLCNAMTIRCRDWGGSIGCGRSGRNVSVKMHERCWHLS